MKLPVVSKAVSLLVANKVVAVIVGISLLVAVPATLYIGENKNDNKEVIQNTEQTEQEEATDNTVPTIAGDKDTSQPTPTDKDNQKKTPSTNTNDTTTSTNPTASTAPTSTNPTAPTTSTPTPTPPYVANWNAVVESGAVGTASLPCGYQAKPCSLNQSLNITVNFYDTTTNRQISISSCSGYTKQSWGTNTAHTAPTTMSVVGGKTCSVSVSSPFYQGSYFVWADVTTNENTPYPTKGFNFISSVIFQ